MIYQVKPSSHNSGTGKKKTLMFDQEEILAMYKDRQHMTYEEIAEKYHCSVSTAKRYCKMVSSTPEGEKIQNDGEALHRGRIPLYEDNDIPLAMLRDCTHMTAAEVAKKYYCSLSAVAKYCKKAKATPEGQEILKENKIRRGRPSLYENDDIPLAMFRDYMHMTAAEVAKKYDCGLSTVAKYCKKMRATPEGQEIMKGALQDEQINC